MGYSPGQRLVAIVAGGLLTFAAVGGISLAKSPSLTTSRPVTGAETRDVLWDIGDQGLFDKTNEGYSYDNGTVVVDLRSSGAKCPTGLGGLTGSRNVKLLRLIFPVSEPSDCWLHVQWNPGGSGTEQFEVRLGEAVIGRSPAVNATERPYESVQDSFELHLPAGEATLELGHLSGDGLHFLGITLSRDQTPPAPLNPELEFPTASAYESEIREPAVMLDSAHVRLFAPKRYEQEARIIHGYLVKAYDELHRLTGADTRYRIVVYHFPESNPHFSGGTSNCTIRYGYRNLDLSKDPEWKAHRVPHVSGYIEEMAHNFVSDTGSQFGWEMVGWSIGMKASLAVAGNPTLQRSFQETRRGQDQTFQQYVRGGYVFPKTLPANQCDRIHAHILWQSEQEYGPQFWPDFFEQIRSRRTDLAAARDRDQRYRITVECFDALPGLEFKAKLKNARVSLTTDVKSLQPESLSWNRRFLAPGEAP